MDTRAPNHPTEEKAADTDQGRGQDPAPAQKEDTEEVQGLAPHTEETTEGTHL